MNTASLAEHLAACRTTLAATGSSDDDASWPFLPKGRLLATQMRSVQVALEKAAYTDDRSGCDPEACSIPTDSADELSETAEAFNGLIRELARSHEIEEAIPEFAAEMSGTLDVDQIAARGLRAFLAQTGSVSSTGGSGSSVCEAVRATEAGRQRTIPVTVSVGGAAFPGPDIEDDQSLLRRADEALYVSKRRSRDTVHLAS